MQVGRVAVYQLPASERELGHKAVGTAVDLLHRVVALRALQRPPICLQLTSAARGKDTPRGTVGFVILRSWSGSTRSYGLSQARGPLGNAQWRENIVVPLRPASLAWAISTLLDDEELRRRLGEAAYTRATGKFSLAKMIAGTLAVYDRALDAKCAPP